MNKTKTTEHFAIEEAQSEIRTRVLEIRAIASDKITPATRGREGRAGPSSMRMARSSFRASLKALRAEQETGVRLVDAEARELRVLTDKANAGDIFAAAVEHRNTEGETSELQKHFGLNSNQVPLEMLRINRSVEEHRAAATVPGSIGDAVQGEVVTPVYSAPATAHSWASSGPL